MFITTNSDRPMSDKHLNGSGQRLPISLQS